MNEETIALIKQLLSTLEKYGVAGWAEYIKYVQTSAGIWMAGGIIFFAVGIRLLSWGIKSYPKAVVPMSYGGDDQPASWLLGISGLVISIISTIIVLSNLAVLLNPAGYVISSIFHSK